MATDTPATSAAAAAARARAGAWSTAADADGVGDEDAAVPAGDVKRPRVAKRRHLLMSSSHV